MNEIKRLQELAGIIEIKVNNPKQILQAKDIGDDEYNLYFNNKKISFGRLDDNNNLEIFFHDENNKFQKIKYFLNKYNMKYNEDEDHFDQFLYIPKEYIKFNN